MSYVYPSLYRRGTGHRKDSPEGSGRTPKRTLGGRLLHKDQTGASSSLSKLVSAGAWDLCAYLASCFLLPDHYIGLVLLRASSDDIHLRALFQRFATCNSRLSSFLNDTNELRAYFEDTGLDE